MKRIWQIINLLSVAFALVMNFLVGAQYIDVPSIGEVSDRYATFLTPASYAFSIWSLIYLLLVVFAVYQARDLFAPDESNDLPKKIGPYFALANVGNALWTYVFVSDYTGLSVVILVGMLLSLFMLLGRLDIALFDAPPRTVFFVWWPLMLYAGWVLIATVVNIATWLGSLDITVSAGAAVATLLLIGAGLLGLLLMRSQRELVLAATWGIVAIGVHQYQTEGSQAVMVTAFGVSSIVAATAAIHAYSNRDRNVLKFLR